MITRIPGIEYAAPPRSAAVTSALTWPPRLVVIHDTGNTDSTRYSEAHYAATRTDQQSFWTSAHAYVDSGGALGSLALNLRAWAAYSYANAYGFHIEICRKDLANGAALDYAAGVVRQLCQAAGIPMVKLSPQQVASGQRGICGHADITIGLGVGDHYDPSPFDWPGFIARVTTTREDEDGMQQITIAPGTDATSVSIPPVKDGGWPRPAFLNITNDTGSDRYGLRVWLADGAGNWAPLPGWQDGVKDNIASGHKEGAELPKGTTCISISRVPVTAGGAVYAGSLSAALDIGPIGG